MGLGGEMGDVEMRETSPGLPWLSGLSLVLFFIGC